MKELICNNHMCIMVFSTIIYLKNNNRIGADGIFIGVVGIDVAYACTIHHKTFD